MKKLDFSALKDRLKGLLRFGSKKGDESIDEFEDRYYDESDPNSEDFVDDQDYEDYEEDDLDAPPPQPMTVPKNESESINTNYEPPEFDESIPDGTLPGGTAPREFKLGKAKSSFRSKLKASIKPSSTFKLKIANVFKRSKGEAGAGPGLQGLKEWWNKVGGEFLLQRPFSPEVRPKAHQIFIWLFVASVAVWAGKMIALGLTPKSTSAKPLPVIAAASSNQLDLKSLNNNDIFGAKGDVRDETLTPKKPINQNIVCKTADRKSSLPIELLSTVVLKDSVKSIASVQSRGSREFMNVREGDKVQNLAEVGKINRLRLVLKNLSTGECEFIESDEQETPTRGASPIKVVSPTQGKKIIENQQATGIKNEGNRFTIKKSLRDEMLTNNMSEILTQARAVQIKRPDGTLAFKMTEIVPGSIYAKLNIQDGDVITGINGKSFNNLNEVMTLFSQVRNIDNFQISMEREGTEQTLEYNFE